MKRCRCACRFTCGGPRLCDLGFGACAEQHLVTDCEHDFTQCEKRQTMTKRTKYDRICSRCGMREAAHYMKVAGLPDEPIPLFQRTERSE